MKNRIFLILSLITILAVSCKKTEHIKNETQLSSDSGKFYELAYSDEDNNVIAVSADLGEYKLINAVDPALSPNGKFLAITRNSGNTSNYKRTISILNLLSNEEKSLNIDNDNYYYASWSPDNLKLAFNVFIDNNWQVGLINADLSGYRHFTDKNITGMMMPTFSEDSKFLYAHNLENIYKFDLQGNIIKTISISKLIGEDYFLSSNTRFYLFDNDENIVFNAGFADKNKDEFYDEPPETIFKYNIVSKKITRLLPNTLNAYSINFAGDRNIIFSGNYRNKLKSSIYKLNIETLNLEEIKSKGHNPSVKFNNL